MSEIIVNGKDIPFVIEIGGIYEIREKGKVEDFVLCRLEYANREKLSFDVIEDFLVRKEVKYSDQDKYDIYRLVKEKMPYTPFSLYERLEEDMYERLEEAMEESA